MVVLEQHEIADFHLDKASATNGYIAGIYFII